MNINIIFITKLVFKVHNLMKTNLSTNLQTSYVQKLTSKLKLNTTHKEFNMKKRLNSQINILDHKKQIKKSQTFANFKNYNQFKQKITPQKNPETVKKANSQNKKYILHSKDKQTSDQITLSPTNLLKKISNHRRIRSSSKISGKLIQLNTFFKESSIFKKAQRKIKSQIAQPLEGSNTLNYLLKLKLKTQNDANEIDSIQLITFRNKSPQNYSPQKSKLSFGLNIPNNPKSIDLLTKTQLSSSMQIIRRNQEIRKNSNLKANPKQWQFHNCLTLQKIELYSTNLKLSCEGWTTLDHLELKYLRGWNPKIADDFSPMIRLFIAKIAFQLQLQGKLNTQNFIVRINDKHIYQDEHEKRKQRGQKLAGIAPHSIISLSKLITALLLTKTQDLVIYSVLALGYILNKIQQEENAIIETNQQYLLFIEQTTPQILQQYCTKFQQKCKQICQTLNLVSSKVVIQFNCLYKQFYKKKRINKKRINEWQVTSSSLDIAILFMKCLAYNKFKQSLTYKVFETQIKQQVGWNFWQSKNAMWVNQELVKYKIKAIQGRNNKNNQCCVVWDDTRDIIIAMADCKVNMHWRDTARIQEWVQKHIPRFSKHYCLNMTFYPTDTEKFHKIN